MVPAGSSVHGGKLRLFSVFHLNLSYSSIAASERREVLERCYRPLLRLARDHEVPLGIEASSHTLETIAALDRDWLDELRDLCERGRCEFVGSGYAQIIGPLVPSDVNRANQRLGRDDYRRLGLEPRLALVNEQAWSSGLIEHYLAAGYRGLIMEWDNPSRNHPEWETDWRYRPQIARSPWGERIPLLWNHSIAFQKFQRYAHGELTLDDYLGFLASHLDDSTRSLSLYGNDAEIFDYRPGRFSSEPSLEADEWRRIETLYRQLASRPEYELVLPGRVLDDDSAPAQELSLDSAQEPIPVKKQGKYNVSRWALTGRDDLALNTGCHRILAALRAAGRNGSVGDDEWRVLCSLWSSDFRTHITGDRWDEVQGLLDATAVRWNVADTLGRLDSVGRHAPDGREHWPDSVEVREEGRRLALRTPALRIWLNLARGLAIERLWLADETRPWRLGTLPHGYFEDIRWSADFYTGHLVFEGAGRPKVTDLAPVRPRVAYREADSTLEIGGTVATPLGPVHKRWLVSLDRPRVRLEYAVEWESRPPGRLRLGHVTLNPEAFDPGKLYYATHNGGSRPQTYDLAGIEVDHAEAVSFLVSSSQLLGMTEGTIELGDARSTVRVEVDRSIASVLPMVTHRRVGGSYFCRLSFSAQEMDDTSRTAEGCAPLRVALDLVLGEASLRDSPAG